jgi:hypothetical protein
MVAPVIIGAAIGAGAGILKQKEQERQFREQARLAATQTAVSSFSPEIAPGQLGGRPSLFQNVLAGSLAGAGVANKNISQFGGEGEEVAPGAQPEGAALTDQTQFNPDQPPPNQSFEDPNVLAAAQSGRDPRAFNPDQPNQSRFSGVR